MSEHATITINLEQAIGELHDHLYGANLEHLGQAIYGGVWAEMLRDRKFAGCDRMYTAPSEGLHNVHPSIGVVVPWEAANPDYEAVLYAHDNSTFYTGRQSQRITIRQPDGQARGIKQGDLYLQTSEITNCDLCSRAKVKPWMCSWASRVGRSQLLLASGRRFSTSSLALAQTHTRKSA